MTLDTALIPSPPEDLSEEEQQKFLRLHQLAYFLRHHLTASAVFAGVSATAGTDQKDLGAFQLYVEQLKQDAGNPRDPAEQMLIEQLALAHHNVARLSNRGHREHARRKQSRRSSHGAAARRIPPHRDGLEGVPRTENAAPLHAGQTAEPGAEPAGRLPRTQRGRRAQAHRRRENRSTRPC